MEHKFLHAIFLALIFNFHYVSAQPPTSTIDNSFYIVPDKFSTYNVKMYDDEALRLGGFVPNTRTICVIHGLYGGLTWNTTTTLIDAGIDANFIYMYSGPLQIYSKYLPPPNQPFKISLLGVPVVFPWLVLSAERESKYAQEIARWLTWLHDINYIRGEYIHIIGGFYGAHTAGEAAHIFTTWTGEKVDRISALNPQRFPYFPFGTYRALTGYDANSVDVYHTNPILGIGKGTLKGPLLEFVFNDGNKQPGCSGLDVGVQENFAKILCAHYYAPVIFTESIVTEMYGCNCLTPAIPFTTAIDQECWSTCRDEVRVGYYADTKARGIRYVRTDQEFMFNHVVELPEISKDGNSTFLRKIQINSNRFSG